MSVEVCVSDWKFVGATVLWQADWVTCSPRGPKLKKNYVSIPFSQNQIHSESLFGGHFFLPRKKDRGVVVRFPFYQQDTNCCISISISISSILYLYSTSVSSKECTLFRVELTELEDRVGYEELSTYIHSLIHQLYR
jgi:hypothetical protein